MASSIKPVTISVPDTKMETLKAKLSQATFPDQLPMSESWIMGFPFPISSGWFLVGNMALTGGPRKVDGFGDIDVHFIHQKSERSGSIPLLFCHGWPGSFLEVTKILPLLTNPTGGPSFNVVAPSLPNFGFSGAPRKPGFGIAQYAECVHKLMIKLGYSKYEVTQGGDWGYAVLRTVAFLYPDHNLATHLNYVRANPPTLLKNPPLYLQSLLPMSSAEMAGLERTKWFLTQGFGYNVEQTTRPSTIGAALADSPVATLAWIYEKLHDWTDSYPWTDDEILTWVSVYWFSVAGPAASARIHYEAQNEHPHPREDKRMMEWNGKVRLGLSYFPKDLLVFPKAYGRTLGPVIFEAVHEAGGHFAAWEKPEVLAGDLGKMFGSKGGVEVARVWKEAK